MSAVSVDDWLSRHDGPRRFAMADNTSLEWLDAFLRPRGYRVAMSHFGTLQLRWGRHCRAMHRRSLIKFVDKLRAADGLPKIIGGA